MPLLISSWAIAEKNQISSSTANCWIVLLELTIPGLPDHVYLAKNNEDAAWNGHTWQAFNFDLNEVQEDALGAIPSVALRIANQNQVMDYYIEQYDLYLKVNGYSPLTVQIMVINTGNLGNTTPEVSYIFELQQPTVDINWATFTLGAMSPYRRRVPVCRILKNQCQVAAFKGIECGYTGVATDCDRTLANCKLLGNEARYGGFPGAGDGAINI